MAQAGNMGGLFATVDLDTKAALAEVKKLQTQFRNAFKPTAGGSNAGGLGRVQGEAKKATRDLNKTAKAADRVGDELKEAGTDAKRASGSVKNLGQGLDGVSNNFSNLVGVAGAARSGSGLFAISAGLRAMSGGFKSAASGGAAMAAGVGALTVVVIGGAVAMAGYVKLLTKIGSIALKSSSDLETLLISFESLLQSQSRAAAEFDFLLEAAKVSPFFTDAIVQVDQFLLAQGVLNDELRRGLVQNLIQFGSAANLTADDLQNVSYALGQVYAAGRLTGDEARQLTNQMLGVTKVLAVLPEFANKTGGEIKKMMEDGLISSEKFFEAFFVYTDQFAGASLRQQQSLKGVRDTIIDTFELGLGVASLKLAEINEEFSVLGALRAPLRELLEIVDDIDLAPLSASLGRLLTEIISPLTGFVSGDGSFILNFFQKWLPAAILRTVDWVRIYTTTFRIAFQTIGNIIRQAIAPFAAFFSYQRTGFSAMRVILKIVAGAVAFFATGVISFFALLLAPLGALAGGFIAMGKIAIGVLGGITSLLTGGSFAEGWANAGTEALDSLKDGWKSSYDIMKQAAAGVHDLWEGVANLDDTELPSLEFPTFPSDPDGGGPAFPGAPGADDAAGDGGAAAAATANKAMDTLFNMMERWFGLRSDLEKGFLGADGFSSTISTISSTGKQVIEALTSIGSPESLAAVTQVTNQTQELIKLAELRELAADALKDAEKALADALKERDAFSAKVRSAAVNFATALTTETKITKDLQNFSERGFFYETETEQQTSFLQSLRDRAKALAKFREDMAKLASLGLDEGLLEQFALEGPEAAGAAVAELIGGGADAISEVNALMDEIDLDATGLGDDLGDQLYGQGVSAAEELVNGLQQELDDIEAMAIAITDTIYAALEPFAKEMEEVGKGGGGAINDGLQDSLPDIESTMGDLVSITEGGLHDVSLGIDKFGGETVEGFKDIGEKIRAEWEKTFANVALAWDDFKQTIKDKVTGIGGSLGGWWDDAVRSNPLVNAIRSWFEDRISPEFSKKWETLSKEVRNGAIGVLEAAVKAMKAFVIELIPLPLRVSAKDLYNSMVATLNWFIRKYNSIKFLPDIDYLKYSYSGSASSGTTTGGLSSIPSTGFGDSTTGDASGTGAINIVVKIGETELREIVDTEVTRVNDGQAVYMSTRRI